MIKKTLWLLCGCLLVMQGWVAAQNVAVYQMTINYSIHGSGNTADCGSRYELYAEMENGESRYIAGENIDGLGTGSTWWFEPKTITFPGNNKVRRIRIYAQRRYDNAFDCRTADNGELYTSYFGYPCYDNNFTGLFKGYGGTSQIQVIIRPVSNVYELKIETNERFPSAVSGFRYWIMAHYTDGTQDEISQMLYPDGTAQNSIISQTTSTLHSTPKQIASLEVYSYGRAGIFIIRERTYTTNVYNNPATDYDRTFTDPFMDLMDNSSSIRVTYKKVTNQIVYGPDPSSNILPVTDQIYLRGPSEIVPSQYVWQYSVDGGGSWSNFPAGLQYRNPVYFSGQTLFGANYLTYINRNILFKMVPLCAPERESGMVTLDYRLGAPHILSITPKHISCYGANDGGLSITFDRTLYPGETLNVNLVDLNIPGPGNTRGTDYNINITAPGNTYTWPVSKPLSASSRYKAELIGSYGGIATYTGDAGHSREFPVTEPTPVTFTKPVAANIKCYDGSDGSIHLTAGGGWGGYNLWYKGPADNTYRTQPFAGNAATLGGLRPGTYLIQVKDQQGCPGKAPGALEEVGVTLTQPAAPLVVDAVTPTDPKAFGYSDGRIVVRLKGGTPNGDGSYNIVWTNAGGTQITPVNSTGSGTYTTTLENIPDGTYYLRVTDANFSSAASGSEQGCLINTSYTITQPPLLVVSTTITDSISCKGDGDGIISALATGGKRMGTAPYYTYEWYEIINGTPTPTGHTGTVANGLSTGFYQVKVTDANGIEKLSDIVHLTDPDPLQIQFTETPASCYEGSNGAVTTLVTGGTPAYAYSWSNGGQASSISGLPTGAYTLNIIDYHGCRATNVAFVQQPAEPLQILTPVLTYPRAYGYTDGSIQLLLKGGTPLTGGAYNITWRKADGTVLTGHTSQTVPGGYQNLLSNLGAGDYTVTVTDANYTGPDPNMVSCIITATFTLTEPPPLIVNITEKHYVSCKGDADGVLVATATGGIPMNGPLPYQFMWYKANGAVYNAIGQTTDTARGLTTGTYKVIITDWNGITKESAPFLLVEPDLLQVQLQTRAVSCNGGDDGFVRSTVTGGTLPYSWSWNTGANTPDILDQPAGDYHLLLIDGHGCIQQPSATITEPADPLAITGVTTFNPLAFGYTDGYITVTLNGGTPAVDGSYAVEWLDGNNQVLTTHTETVTPNGYVTRLQDVGDGTYILRVKDAQFALSTNGSTNGCYITGTYILKEPPLLQATISEYRYISCKGDSDGKLAAHATGGIPFSSGLPYAYHWFSIANGTLTAIPQTDSIITGMPTGKYLVKVTDQNNITRESDTFFLAEPGKLSVTFNTSAVTCASGQDGTATAIVQGGTAPFRYEWTNGDTTSTISNLTEGTYLLFVKDAHTCETQNQMDIYIPGGIVIDADIKAPTCNSYCDGYIKTTISGGVPPYRYEWSTGQTGTSLDNLCAGKYTITILDANNCKRIQTFNLPDPAPLLVQLGPDKTLCNGQVWTVNAAIADPLAQYVWGGNPALQAATPQVTLSGTGVYWVNVTDGKGCKGSDTISIQQNSVEISAEFVASTQVFRNENVSFINISNPLPERIEWMIPANRNITVLQNTPLLAELRFADTGVYQIHLRTTVGDCEKLFTKQITVLEQESFTQPGGAQEPFIRSFDVSPNPNTGQFNVRISLDKAADIRLRLFNIISNQLVHDRKESPAIQFNIGYQLNITAGTYLLLLETPMGHAIRKIIISQ